MLHSQEETEKLLSRAARWFLLLSTAAIVYFCAGRLTRILLPFLLAAIPAILLRPVAAYLEKKLKLPRRIGSIVLLILLLLILTVLIFLGCERLILEIQKLAANIGTDATAWSAKISETLDILNTLSEHIPFLSRLQEEPTLRAFWDQVDAKLAEIIADTLTRWSARIPDGIAAFIRSLPGVIVFLLTFLLAAFYLCADLPDILRSLSNYLPAKLKRKLPHGQSVLRRLGGSYLRAYFLLFLLTFAELFIGFCILGLPYVFLPALLISLLDILPLLGVGSMLYPWGVIELLRGNIALGSGLLILCTVMLLIRQVAEPRIIGGSIGLHPLLTLFSAYAGLQLFGLFGMLLGPAAALLIKSLWTPAAPEA